MAGVFLDRDDTLIACRALPTPPLPAQPGDLTDPTLVELLPDALKACRLLDQLGYPLVVITNQGVVARGGITLETLAQIHDRLRSLLISPDAKPLLTAIYACPYHPLGSVEPYNREHPWRKPAPGMLLTAAEDHSLDLESSWMIGDAHRDIDAALAAGLRPEQCLLIGPDSRWPTVLDAARYIARHSPPPSPTTMHQL